MERITRQTQPATSSTEGEDLSQKLGQKVQLLSSPLTQTRQLEEKQAVVKKMWLKIKSTVTIGQDLLQYQSQDLDLGQYLDPGQGLLDLCLKIPL